MTDSLTRPDARSEASAKSVLSPDRPPPAPRKSQGEVVPVYDGGGTAAEDVLDDEVLAAGRPLRDLIPTVREERDAGEVERLDVDAFLREVEIQAEEAKAPRVTFRQRMGKSLEWYNPVHIPGSKRPIVIFALIGVLGGLDDQVLTIIGPELRTEFGTTLTQLAMLSFFTGAFGTLSRIPIGYMVDRVKRVWLVRFSTILINAANILKSMVTSYYQFMFVGTAAGMVGRFGDVADGPMMADYYPSRVLGRVYAVMGVAKQVGGLVGLLFVGWLVTQIGWRTALLSLSVIATLVAVSTFFLKEPVRGGMARQELGATVEEAAIEQRPLGFTEALRAAWSIRTLRINAIAQVVTAFTTPVGLVLATIELERFQLDAFQRSMVMVVTGVAGMGLALVFAPFSERFLRKRPGTIVLLMVGMNLLSSIALIASAFAPNLLLFYGPRLLVGALPVVLVPAYITIAMLVLPPRVRGLGAQVTVPFLLVGQAIGVQLTAMAERMPIQQGLMIFAPFYLVVSAIQLMTVRTIGRDIRAARAASLADRVVRDARERGEEKLLVCRDVDVIYDGAQVLFGVDFDVNAGETVALLGTNGAGKSTLLKAVCGLHMVDNGAVFFEGDDVTATPPHELAQRGMVYVPGGRAVFPGLTVEENLRTATWSSDDLVDERIAVVLDFFPRLRERLAQPAGTLSGGEQQMVALSQAFLMRPKLLLIDELSLGLAPAVVEQLLEILRAIRDQGTTLVLVEQSLNVAATIAERGVFMDKGRIEFDGPIDDLVRRPDLVRSIFMGGAAAGASVGRRVKRAEDETQVALGCQDVAVGFGGLQALDGVTFQVAAGEIVGIMGPNGAGKTTLFDVLSGYLHPDRGKVILGDRDVTRLPPYARAKLGLGRSFQSAQLFGALTVRETIAVALEKRAPKNPLAAAFWAPGQRQREQRLRERVDGYIELLGLGDHADKFIRELSTGSRRAVDVACAMANEPAVLLLDEPSSGLAQAEIEALGPTLARLSRETGCSLVVIEHDLPLLTSLSDRLVAMELGAVLADGPPELVTRDPRVLTSYLNASAAVLQRSGSRLAAVLDALGAPPSDEQPEGS